jgi:hypothetical protein
VTPSVSKWSRQVSIPELASMLIMSFRYALGRQSTAPSAVQSLLGVYSDVLQPWQKEQIVRDIEQAIEGGFAGMDCDIATWTEVAKRLKTEKGAK